MSNQVDRRKSERRVSPAIGDFALQEREKLLAKSARLREALQGMVNAHTPTTDATEDWWMGWHDLMVSREEQPSADAVRAAVIDQARAVLEETA